MIDRSFQEVRLRYAVDYATEAAFRSALEVQDLGLDYSAMDSVVINPSMVLDTFKALMCISYDMAISRENFAHLENFIPFAVLTTNDGYFITSMQEVHRNTAGGGEFALTWSIKKPYTMLLGNILYGFNLHNESWVSVTESPPNVLLIQDGTTFPPGVSREVLQRSIMNQISGDINFVISERNRLNTTMRWDNVFNLPSGQTALGVNTLVRPSLIILFQGSDFAGTQRLQTVSVGGFRVRRRDVILGFTEGGVRFYCFEGQLPADRIHLVEDFFFDMESAALAGFSPHPIFIKNPR